MEMQGLCDLHTHTTASDGMQSPADNVRLARQKGLAAVAITDHDTVAGVPEALEAGRQYGIIVVPGIEISTRMKEKDIHVLGYYVDYRDPVFLERLEGLRRTRDERNGLIIAKLNDLGIPITMEEIKNRLGRPLEPDETLGRPHIADVLVAKGYAADLRDAFDKYLAEGAAAYISVPRLSPGEGCRWIREAGGVPVLAHPGLYGDDELVRSILEQEKPDGLEVSHSDHDAAAEAKYRDMAESYGLIPTGGSDFHGMRQGVVFHGELGGRTADIKTLERLQAAVQGA
ncbi:PHP domain-containing protein [Paenibacillus sp. P96]|uniref:PHP domain-containing protein n=1 Tax=Paenibacillus zeirhizosphaerae TaxID=2987519 RepID=A0ABT9FQ22_9BACL|nr:PHP domain-containing protein [Paenibacillus sp. P96]MDP4096833.1 PHP domain-containing protein [Paenibacillus sp. P96]